MAYRKRRRNKHRVLVDEARPYYDKMLEAQDSKCAICGREPYSARRFDIDHDHKEMFIRGLLCWRCNQWLWSFVTIEILEAAIEYLKRGPEWFERISETD